MLRLTVAEYDREIHAHKKLLMRIPELENEIVALMMQLQKERAETARLCIELENPANASRYHALEGRDLTPEELQHNAQLLESRLNLKEEQLLEKKLLLDQVTTLTRQARQEAQDGRDGTLQLAQKVNDLQSKIKDMTRKMMATVSELSMYQASALKLEQEKNVLEETLESARERLDEGMPPTADAETEWCALISFFSSCRFCFFIFFRLSMVFF